MTTESAFCNGTCTNCGLETQGRNYQFYYGWQINQKTARSDLLVARVTSTTTTYRVGGSETYFLCTPCVRRLNRASNIGLVALGLLIGIPVFYYGLRAIPMLSSGDKTWWQTGLFCFCPGVLLIFGGLVGLIGLFSKNVATDDGETAAIKLARKRKIQGKDTTYWKTKEYEKLKRKLP
jgi:hypothetical protein